MPLPDDEAISDICAAMVEADTAWKALPPMDQNDGNWKDIYLTILINGTIVPKLKDAESGDPDCPNAPPPPFLA